MREELAEEEAVIIRNPEDTLNVSTNDSEPEVACILEQEPSFLECSDSLPFEL